MAELHTTDPQSVPNAVSNPGNTDAGTGGPSEGYWLFGAILGVVTLGAFVLLLWVFVSRLAGW